MPEIPLAQKLVLLCVAGAAGTLARFFLAGIVQRLHPYDFPWGTLAVNALGCLLFGIVWSLAEGRGVISPQTRAIILVGFMGAFTTFSTFAFETSQLMHRGEMLAAGGNLLLSNVLCIVLVFAGIALGRLF
jgi:fluoride exporter